MKNFVDQLKGEVSYVLGKVNKHSNFGLTLIFLKEIYDEFLEDVIVQDFALSERSHYIALKIEDYESFVFIDLNEESVELRVFSIEKNFFLNETSPNKIRSILKSLFRGEYLVKLRYEEEEGKVFMELIWNNASLMDFNWKNELPRGTHYFDKELEKIQCFVKH